MCCPREAKKPPVSKITAPANAAARPGAESPEDVESGDSSQPDLQHRAPLEQHRERVHRGVRGDQRAQQNQRMEIARLDIGEHRKAVVDIRVPEREMALRGAGRRGR